MKGKSELELLIQRILDEMKRKKFSNRTIKNYWIAFNHLKRLADKRDFDSLTEELSTAFLKDASTKAGNNQKITMRLYRRCIRLLQSAYETGTPDWTRCHGKSVDSLITEPYFCQLLETFKRSLSARGFAANTITGYQRIVIYFLDFCQQKKYTDLSFLQPNDVSTFIAHLYRKVFFKPTTITSALSGLRLFLAADESTKQFLTELPVHLPKEHKIIEVYDRNEIIAINDILVSGKLSKRDTAICKLLLETGLRGNDICNLKLSDIDWNHDVLKLIQKKTGAPLILPLRESYGNAIADYLLNERPECDAEYVFIRSFAPFERLSVSAIWCILKRMDQIAEVKVPGRISGTRMTRHNAASAMLRSGVPMSDISSALGHRDPNIVSAYLTTDSDILRTCTLPIPPVGRGSD